LIASKQLGWIGVDIGTHAVKLAQIVRDGGGARLYRTAVIPRATYWTGDDGQALGQPLSSSMEIRAARECVGFAGRNGVGLLPMNVCQLRGLNVPPGEEHERRSIIEDELSPEWEEQNVSMNFDFWELEGGQAERGADSFNVNVLAVSRPWVGQVAGDFRAAGLDCWAVDGTPLAMARAVALVGGAASGRRALAVDWGCSNTTLCVVGDGRAWYTRRSPNCGFGRALEQIASTMGVTLDQARHLVDVHGLPSPAGAANDDAADTKVQAAIYDALAPTLERLCDQVRRTLQFLEMQRRYLHPVAVWMLGGGGSLRNVGPWLAHELQIPVHVWTLPCEPVSMASAGNRAALFAGAAALSALAWRAA
jgi:Tfp pilus assembly PilM family ATPase